jgi:hypothetical protein
MSYKKRLTRLIRISLRSLNNGTAKWAENWVNWRELERFEGFGIFGVDFREGVQT